MKRIARFLSALALGMVPAVAAAADDDCLVTYEEFEEHVAHVDVPHCPRGEISDDKGFCRLTFGGDKVVVYVFAENGDDYCLAQARAYPVEEIWP